MGRAFIKSSFGTVVMAGGLFLSGPLPASEGVESGVPGLDSPSAAQDVKAPVLSRPVRARRSLLWGVARAVQPMLNYSRRHVSRLLPSCRHLPLHLEPRPHDDYMVPGLKWIPRGWTTFDWGEPSLLAGNQRSAQGGAPKPIGERGSIQVSAYPDLPVPFCWLPMYFAFTLPNGVHFRLGARWDDVDAYVVAPSIAIKTDVDPPARPIAAPSVASKTDPQ